jgi:hypothetical protein
MNLRSRIKTHDVRSPVFLILLTAFVAIGCHKKDGGVAAATAPATAPDAMNETPATGTDPVKPPPPPAYITAKADNVVRETASGEADPFMSGQLRIFVQQKGRMPLSFTEFASTRLDSIPRPPDGTKWAIDAATVQVEAVQINQ